MIKAWITIKGVNKMYFEEAVKRINKINWELFGEVVFDEKNLKVSGLGTEYLKNIALFFHEQHISPINPLFANVAELLGYKEKVEIKNCCNIIVKEALKNKNLPKYIIECYLQLAKLADIDKKYEEYLKIYEPIICLIESGFNFGYKEGGWMIYRMGFYPLNTWYTRSLKKCGIGEDAIE